MVLHAPWDIEYWFVNVFSGNLMIFTLIMIMFITYISAKLRMEMTTFTVMMLLFAGIMMARGDNSLIILMILILGPLLFWITRRIVE